MKRALVSIVFLAMIFVLGLLSVKDNGDAFSMLFEQGLSGETGSVFESEMAEGFPLKSGWINVNGAVNKVMGRTADIDKDWYRTDDGQMIYSMDKMPDEELDRYASAVSDLSDAVRENGGRLYYVQLPFKIADSGLMPDGAEIYGDHNGEVLVSKLEDRGVDVFDLNSVVKKEVNDRRSLFFDTDQHWKPEAALWGAGKINRYLEEKEPGWIYDGSLFEEKNFSKKVYRDWFLGSIGKKIGNIYSGTDDFSLIWPKYRTDFDFTASSAAGKIERHGDFRDVMFKTDNLKKDYFNVNTYATYIGGDYKRNTIINNLSDNRKEVLMLRDSFSCALLPFMSLGVRDITTIDLRHYKSMTIKEYIEKKKPDIVLICYNPSVFSEQTFDFG